MHPKNARALPLTACACLLTLALLAGACSSSPEPVGAVVVAPLAKETPAPAAVTTYEPPSVGPLQRWNSTKARVIELLRTDSTP